MTTLTIMQGDITRQNVDAIVTAANAALLGGGGVDGAVHEAAGPDLLIACQKLGGCPSGEARITPGYRLPARWVIHTVGPVWQGGNAGEDAILAQCYRQCFAVAREYGLRSVAFPSISTGAFGFPVRRAARIALTEIKQMLRQTEFESIVVVCFEPEVYTAYRMLRAEIGV
ncbi:MAG: O-acetyl-ADP-ribose deacetylase [Chloroflexi bacterium]|nr:O-acetyl-ADP-ribose deacetylase [Chloroflexota bacterium]